MNRTVKLFANAAEQATLARQYRTIQRYPGFAVLEVDEDDARALAARFPLEDITDQYAITLGGERLDTSRPRVDAKGKTLAHPAYGTAPRLRPGPHHYLVQFVGPIKQAWLTAVKRAGGELRAPFGGFTYVVRADEAALERIAAQPSVRWVGHLPHRARVEASALEDVAPKAKAAAPALPRTQALPGTFRVQFFDGKDLQAALPAVRKLGWRVVAREPKAGVLVVEAPTSKSARKKALDGLSAVHGVRAIALRSLKRTSNDVAPGLMGAVSAIANPGLGLSGQGETLAVCDTGLDTGDPASIHPDFSGRVAWIKSYPMTPDFAQWVSNPGGNDGPADLDSGHGTHVAGSVLGSGAASAGLPNQAQPIRGLAHKARLVFQAVEQEMRWKDPTFFTRYGRYLLTGIPNDLTGLLSDAYRRGARIHSNSWGGGEPGEYDPQCEQLDRFVWSHKTFCVLVAAGNDGTDRDGDGRINPMSVTSPGTAKNCITVGACESRRPQFNGARYGQWWPKDYPVAPFRDAPMADDPDQVVPFSSRGPTRDGRIKPEVIAPGTFVLSTRSSMIAPNNFAWARFQPSNRYFYMGGTSMATPLTAGAVALVREYLRKVRKQRSPSAALLKAMLVAGAVRLLGTAGPGTLCDNHQGFGRVNLDAVLAPPAPLKTILADQRRGLATGSVASRKVTVLAPGQPLRIVLAYTDYPGPTLVNNLNLLVRGPDGERYVGNQPATGATVLDTANNVEVVQVEQAGAGVWTIDVVASNVPSGPQDYALVIRGNVKG
jgi:subtilisin family serine protease